MCAVCVDVISVLVRSLLSFLFFNDTATTEIYTYGHPFPLHDALPISSPARISLPPTTAACSGVRNCRLSPIWQASSRQTSPPATAKDRQSTSLNSSH